MIALETKSSDRREDPRKSIDEPAEVTLYTDGRLYWGTIMDLSMSGACFSLQITQNNPMPQLTKGWFVMCYITTTVGTAKCCGKICWIERKRNIVRWGISFAALPCHDDDSLSILLYNHLESNVAKRSDNIFAGG